MNKTLRDASLSSLLLLCFLFITSHANAQTPGLIYKIATNGGNKILDPDGNGYVSKTNLGFQLVGGNRLDEGPEYSEIPYRPFPVFMDEPLADLKTGGSYGHTDFAPKVYANGQLVGSPMASYYDGKNFLFRIRLAGQSTASKGYSILIDTNSDLTGTGTNPGFEFEVLLATNFDVRVYDYRTNPSGALAFSGSVDQYSQKAIAGSTGGGDADYFYDFYVPMSAFGNGITPTTQLRMTGVTVTSAKSGIFGTTSDFGGVDDNVYSGTTAADIWKSIITNTPLSTPTDIKDTGFTPVTAAAPTVNSPVYTNTTEVSGTSIESTGSVITVHRNGVSIGTTTVSSNGSWKLQNLSATLLQAGDKIKANVKPTAESISSFSSEVVVVTGTCTTPAPQIVSREPGGKGFNFNTTILGPQVIKIYKDGVLYQVSNTIDATYTPYPVVYKCGTGNCFPSGSYTVSVTPTGQCESPVSNSFCESTTGTTGSPNTPPSISNTSLTTTSTSITGTYNTAGTLKLFKNGTEVAGLSATTTTTNFNWTINIPGGTLAVGDRIWVVGTPTTTNCSSTDASNILTVQGQSTAPTIKGTYCGPITSVSGTSTEVAGSTITVYVGSTQVGTTTVNSYGSWTATITSQSSGTITATAKASNKTVSAASAGVIIGSPLTATSLSITGTETNDIIYEGSTSVKGKAPANSIVTLYINGSAYVDSKTGTLITATATSGGDYLFSSISPFELYAGAKLTVTARSNSSSCESTPSASYTVACNAASATITVKLAAEKFCPATPAYINLNTSEAGVIYNIYKKESNGSYSLFGPSKLGTGSALVLQSDPVTIDGTILQIKTIKVGADCQYTIGGDLTVSLYPAVPKSFTVTATPETSSCANVTTTITVQAAETGYSYQLIINNATKDKIGAPIVPTSNGNISFPPVTVTSTTTYGVVITGTTSGCVAENTILKTITISGGPDVNRTVSASPATICAGTSASISVATQGNTFTYKIYQEGNATALATFTGNGATIATNLTTPFTTTGVKNFYVTVSGGSCSDLKMAQTVTITVTDGTGGTVSAGPNATTCGSTYTLAGSIPTPGTGLWTVISKPASAANPAFSNNTLYNTTVSNLVSGEYTFQWAVKSSCNNVTTTSSIIITVNCPAEYSIRSNKPITEYSDNEIIATVTDPEGIKSAQLLVGKGSLPPGIRLNTTTGDLRVFDRFSLASNNYNFVVRITDNVDKTTDIPLALRFYSSSIRPPDITPLPVELMSFTATVNHNSVVLNWMTASELDNDRFEIERSEDGKLFSKIGTVAGNGTSNRKIKYSFTDTRPLPEVSYYRLKQVDFDGTHKYSKTVSVKNKALTANTILEAYPNPVSEKLFVTITTPAPEEATLTLYNLQGRLLQTIKTTLERGMNNYELDTQQLASGIYIIRITGNNSDVSAKVLKK